MKRFWTRVATMWQPISAWLIVVASIIFLFGYQLGNLLPGPNSYEIQTAKETSTLRTIAGNPVNAPYKVTQFGIQKITDSLTARRAVNAFGAIILVGLFYMVVTKLYSRYTAVLGTLLFASSSSLLVSGRMATANIMLLSLFVLIAIGYVLRFKQYSARAWIIACLAVGVSLYVPGMIFFIVAGVLWQFKTLRKPFRADRPLLTAACTLILIASIAPIVFILIKNPYLWREFLGLPDPIPPLGTILRTAASIPAGLFALSPVNPSFRLGRQPILDVFASCMFILGCYSLVTKRMLDRTKLLAGIFLIAILWAGISGNHENILLLLPFVYVVITAGMTWLLQQWYVIFPRNPLARSAAMVLIGLAVLASCTFQLRRYFIAWPQTPETIAAYSQNSSGL